MEFIHKIEQYCTWIKYSDQNLLGDSHLPAPVGDDAGGAPLLAKCETSACTKNAVNVTKITINIVP